ncbi:hypothetical protein B6U96_10255 [Archaeoglobales archaeon ex4484_92]|nr:MAG: hypothetical protein B6U96_10255 [Archaeoglobales archaeon ex4484_92]
MEEVLPNIYLVDTLSYVEKGTISSYILNFDTGVIIDPGTAKGASILLDEIRRFRLEDKIKYIAPTHIHIDHGGGAATLAKALNAKILVHPKGAKHVINPEKLWIASKQVLGELAEIYGKPESIEENKVIVVDDLQKFDLGDDILVVYHAPGHAPHMLAYYLQRARILFPADAVGMYYNGMVFPLTPPPFDRDLAINTLKRLLELEVKYIGFTHFGLVEGNWTIKKSYEKIILWSKIAEEVANENKDLNEFIKRLCDADPEVKELIKGFSEKPIMQGFIYTAASGLLSWAKR